MFNPEKLQQKFKIKILLFDVFVLQLRESISDPEQPVRVDSPWMNSFIVNKEEKQKNDQETTFTSVNSSILKVYENEMEFDMSSSGERAKNDTANKEYADPIRRNV